MSALTVLAACAVGGGVAAVATLLVPPARRLAPRVRPYAVVARAAFGQPPDVAEPTRPAGGGTVARLFGPPLRALVDRMARAGDARGDEALARLLAQAGDTSTNPADYRVRQVMWGAMGAVVAAGAVGVLTRAPLATLVAAAAGYTLGATRPRRDLEQAVTLRAARIRAELYTVNQLLAMHVRTGSGPIQAVQRIVARGRGAVIDELQAVLAATRRGVAEVDAFRRAAELTPEPSAARTYQLLAAGTERGADLGAALLALSEDIRDARREQLHKEAVRRRAAMLIPTIAILAPIMLLFIAAPLPSVVLGHR